MMHASAARHNTTYILLKIAFFNRMTTLKKYIFKANRLQKPDRPVRLTMYTIIHTSLIRQSKALSLLCELMEEEYAALLDRNTDSVVALEFSIQELIRQLDVEKATVITRMAGVRVADAGWPGQPDLGSAVKLDSELDKVKTWLQIHFDTEMK